LRQVIHRLPFIPDLSKLVLSYLTRFPYGRAEDVIVGDVFDVQDRCGNWCPAIVRTMANFGNEMQYNVSFFGWPTAANEDVEFSRMKPLGVGSGVNEIFIYNSPFSIRQRPDEIK
jgi:hypothetical protein